VTVSKTRATLGGVKRALPLLAAACLGLSGCRTTYHAVRGTAKLAAGTVELAGKTAYQGGRLAVHIVKDFDYYAKKAATLRGYRDSGRLYRGDVTRALGARRYPKLPPYSGGFRWPLTAGVVSSEFGRRWGRMHDGIDIAADMGEPVLAAADGRVVYAGDGLRGYGNVVIVRHDEKLSTLYAHNSALRVHVGELVKSGQTIALLGSTGHSTGPHVHFEIREGSQFENPRSMLPKSRF